MRLPAQLLIFNKITMWYYTSHKSYMHWWGVLKQQHEIRKEFQDEYGYDNSYYPLNSCWIPDKWYDLMGDLIEFSKRYPDITFGIKGHWEWNADIREAVVKNWQQHLWKIIQAFDHEKAPAWADEWLSFIFNYNKKCQK